MLPGLFSMEIVVGRLCSFFSHFFTQAKCVLIPSPHTFGELKGPLSIVLRQLAKPLYILIHFPFCSGIY